MGNEETGTVKREGRRSFLIKRKLREKVRQKPQEGYTHSINNFYTSEQLSGTPSIFSTVVSCSKNVVSMSPLIGLNRASDFSTRRTFKLTANPAMSVGNFRPGA